MEIFPGPISRPAPPNDILYTLPRAALPAADDRHHARGYSHVAPLGLSIGGPAAGVDFDSVLWVGNDAQQGNGTNRTYGEMKGCW